MVYYGPGLCGKTTNLEQIHQKSDPATRGKLLSLATQTDRTLFFDLLPIELREIKGVKIRLQVYTVPGQVFYNETRKLVLKNADAVVMVLDSQRAMREKNIESMNNLFENLKELDLSADSLPVVLQYNKRDLRDVMPVEEMDRIYNTRTWPRVEAAAVKGEGVQQTLKVVTKLVYDRIRREHFKDTGDGEQISFRDEGGTSRRSPRASRPLAAPSAPQAAHPPQSQPIPATRAELSPEAIQAIRQILEENLLSFKEKLDLPFFNSAQGHLSDLSMTVLKLGEETKAMRGELSDLRGRVQELIEELKRAASDPQRKAPLFGALFQRK